MEAPELVARHWRGFAATLIGSLLVALGLGLADTMARTIFTHQAPGLGMILTAWERLTGPNSAHLYTGIGIICALVLSLYFGWPVNQATNSNAQDALASQDVREDLIFLLSLSGAATCWLAAPWALAQSPALWLPLAVFLSGFAALAALREQTMGRAQLARLKRERALRGLLKLLDADQSPDVPLDAPRFFKAMKDDETTTRRFAALRRREYRLLAVLIGAHLAYFLLLFASLTTDLSVVIGFSLALAVVTVGHCVARYVFETTRRISQVVRSGRAAASDGVTRLFKWGGVALDLLLAGSLVLVVLQATNDLPPVLLLGLLYAGPLAAIRAFPPSRHRSPTRLHRQALRVLPKYLGPLRAATEPQHNVEATEGVSAPV